MNSRHRNLNRITGIRTPGTARERTGRTGQQRVQPHSLVTDRTHLQPARVLMTADCVGGVWTYALDLARGLAERDVDVVLATMGALPTSEQRAEACRIPNLTLCPSSLKLEWMDDCWQDVKRAGEWLLELEDRFAPDVVHLNGYVHAALPFHAPTLAVAHSCVLSWWEAVKGESAGAKWQRYRDEVTEGLLLADCVVAPTTAMLRALQRCYEPLVETRVIPNGRQSHRYRAGAKEPFILAAGRLWDEAKNIALLEQIAPRLAWPVQVAGGQTHPGGANVACYCPNRGATMGVAANKFHLLGSLNADELADRYARAAIYALPARYEPFGLTALEAALSGCALVLGDIASLREVWDDAALYVNPNDAVQWERALAALIADPALRGEMADRAQARARHYGLAAMTEGYLDVYGQLLHRYRNVPLLPDAMPFSDLPEETVS